MASASLVWKSLAEIAGLGGVRERKLPRADAILLRRAVTRGQASASAVETLPMEAAVAAASAVISMLLPSGSRTEVPM
jgi:hypothetical protein